MSTTVTESWESGIRPSGLRTDTLATSIVLMLVMTIVQRLVGFGRGILFVRWFAPEQLGLWDMAFGFMNLAAPLAVIGLPGSFGRYFEYYRGRRQLRTYLRRTTLMSITTAVCLLTLIVVKRDWFSELIFGSRGQGALVLWVVVCLAAVATHNFLGSLFMAARMNRIVTMLQFFQSVLFAMVSIALCTVWQAQASTAVAGFALATFICVLGSYPFVRQVWREGNHDHAHAIPRQTFWAKLLPFAAWMWITNILANLFEIVDRYMILHHSGFEPDEALRQVGYYHSSRLIPLLFVAIVGLLGTMLTPHLSHDWEAGRRQAVVRQLNTTIKSVLLVLFAAAVGVLFIAPALFSVVFEGKFTGGLAQLPLTLAYCTWFGTFAIAQNYLWCAEKARYCSLSLIAGLLLNIALNLVLLPRFGLHGAVMSTTAANIVALLLVYFFSWRHGMQIDRSTWVLTALPSLLWLGPGVAAVALVIAMALVCLTPWLLDEHEKRRLWTGLDFYWHRMKSLAGRKPGADSALIVPPNQSGY